MVSNPPSSVSVVIPCFRCSDTILRAVSSVWDQTLRPFEVILVDDASGDNTLEFLISLEKKFPSGWVKVIPLAENGGASVARNRGWESASGTYIAFLDSDEAWHPRKLELQTKWMDAEQDIWMSGHFIEREYAHSQKPLFATSSDSSSSYVVSRHMLLLSNRFVTSSVILRRVLPCRFDERKRRSEDYLLWLNICLSGWKVAILPLKLASRFKADFGEGGLSGNLVAMQIAELDTFWQLSSTKKITFSELAYYSAISALKFFRRIYIDVKRRVLFSAKI